MVNLFHSTETVQDNTWIVVGSNMSEVDTSNLVYKFIYLEESNSTNGFNVHCFCPNSTKGWAKNLNYIEKVLESDFVLPGFDLYSRFE